MSVGQSIEVAVSSAHVVSAVGAFVLLLLGVIGYFASKTLGEIRSQVRETGRLVLNALTELKVHSEVLSDLKHWRLQREDIHERKNEEQVRLLREEIARLKARDDRE